MVKWTRPSGSTIELADTDEMKDFAKEHGFKRQRKSKGINNGYSGKSNHSGTTADIGTRIGG